MAAVRPRHASLALLACLLGSGGCAAERETPLLDLSGVSPARVEPGVPLAVEGAGFPEGRAGTLTLTGTLHRPGARPLEVERVLAGRAVAPDRFEVEVTSEIVASLGGRGTFSGSAELRYEGVGEGAEVSGLLAHVEVDLLPPATERLAGSAARLRAAAAQAEGLGLVLAEEQPDDGVWVAEVRAGSPAARQGLAPGAWIGAIDGVRIAEVSDFRARPDTETTVLLVRRPDGAAEREVRLPAAPTRAASDAPSALAVTSLVLVSLFLVLVAPTARVTTRLSRSPSPGGPGGGSWLLGGSAPAAAATAWGSPRAKIALACLAATATLASVAWVTLRMTAGRAVLCLLVGAAATRAVVAATTPGRGVARALGQAALGTLASLAAVLAAGLLTAARPAGLVALPWRWPVFESPVGLLAFVSFSLSTLGAVRPDARAPGPVQAIARLHLLLVATLGAALFLGGPAGAAAGARAGLAEVGALVAEAWLLVAVGLGVSHRFPGLDGRGFKLALPLALASVAGALAWIAWPGADAAGRLSGPLFCALAAALGVAVAVQRRQRSVELELHPFL